MSAIYTAQRLAAEPLSSIAVWSGPGINFVVYCLEPGGDTLDHPRIPPGEYPMHLRTVGGFHEDYKRYYDRKFGAGWHQGMIEIDDVPGRDFILLHVGNFIKDTKGCSLCGLTYGRDTAGHYQVGNSRAAYERLYPIILKSILAGPTRLRVVAEKGTA